MTNPSSSPSIQSKPLHLLELLLKLCYWALLVLPLPALIFLFFLLQDPEQPIDWINYTYAGDFDLSSLSATHQNGTAAAIKIAADPTPVVINYPMPRERWAFTFFATAALVLAMVTYYFFVIRTLLQILASVRQGDPFVPQNAQRLSLVGRLIIAATLTKNLFTSGMSFYVANSYSTTGCTIHGFVDISWTMIFLGLAALVLAEIFKVGTLIREDQSLTI